MACSQSTKKRWYFILILVVLGFLMVILCLLLCLPSKSDPETGPLGHQNGELVFDGSLADDILSVGENLLTIEYAYVEDNGEEQQLPHGPYGSIHVVVYRPDQSLEAP
ncbi:MAG TPA: hypothetical protein PKH77_27325 [Anaerolineae bacterium]|nr:hypothetical protein [Anaerolineae bacterium]